MTKVKMDGRKRKLGLWGLLASALVLGAAVLPSGASMPIKDAQTYACSDSCYFNFRTCLMQGKGMSFCSVQYQRCAIECTAGSARAPEAPEN